MVLNAAKASTSSNPTAPTSDGSRVLPFKPNLLQTALDTRKPITPAAISYQATSGDLKNDVCYWGGHTFATHLFRLAKIQNLTARLILGSAASLTEDRKAAARALHAEVSVLIAPSK